MSQAKITKGFAVKHCHVVVRRSFVCMYCRHISCVGVKKLEFQLSHQSKSDPQDWNIRHPHDFNTDWNNNKNVLRHTKLNNLIDLPKIFNRLSVVVLRSLGTRSLLPTLSSDESEHHCLHRGREKHNIISFSLSRVYAGRHRDRVHLQYSAVQYKRSIRSTLSFRKGKSIPAVWSDTKPRSTLILKSWCVCFGFGKRGRPCVMSSCPSDDPPTDLMVRCLQRW